MYFARFTRSLCLFNLHVRNFGHFCRNLMEPLSMTAKTALLTLQTAPHSQVIAWSTGTVAGGLMLLADEMMIFAWHHLKVTLLITMIMASRSARSSGDFEVAIQFLLASGTSSTNSHDDVRLTCYPNALAYGKLHVIWIWCFVLKVLEGPTSEIPGASHLFEQRSKRKQSAYHNACEHDFDHVGACLASDFTNWALVESTCCWLAGHLHMYWVVLLLILQIF